jgi:hypothetical protein
MIKETEEKKSSSHSRNINSGKSKSFAIEVPFNSFTQGWWCLPVKPQNE